MRDVQTERRWVRWGAPAVVAVACLLPLWGLWRAPGPPMEEGFMLVFPELVLRGKVPNLDFLHLYGPGSLWVLAAAFKAFGTSLWVERAVGFAQLVGVAFGIYAVVRPWGRWLAASGAVMTAVILLPPAKLTALAWVGGLALALWSLHAALPPEPDGSRADAGSDPFRWRVVAAGLLGGFALLYRPDLVLAVGLSGTVVWLGLGSPARRRYLIGLGLGLSPYLVHVAMAGPRAVVNGLFVEPVFDLRGGRRLPLPPRWDYFDGFLQRAGWLVEPTWPLPDFKSPSQLTIWLGLLAFAIALLMVAGVRQHRRGDRRLLVLALFALGLVPQALQRPDSTHIAWVSCVALGLLPLAVIEVMPRWRSGIRSVAGALTPLVLTFALVPHFTWRSYAEAVAWSADRNLASYEMRHEGRVFYYGRQSAADDVNQLVKVVDAISEPGDRLFVGTGDLRKTPYSEAYLYYLLPRLEPATRYIEMDPGIANAPDSGLADELASADVVILSSIRDDWAEPNESVRFGSDAPNQVLAARFCLVESFGEGVFGRGLFELYRRCR